MDWTAPDVIAPLVPSRTGPDATVLLEVCSSAPDVIAPLALNSSGRAPDCRTEPVLTGPRDSSSSEQTETQMPGPSPSELWPSADQNRPAHLAERLPAARYTSSSAPAQRMLQASDVLDDKSAKPVPKPEALQPPSSARQEDCLPPVKWGGPNSAG